MVTEGIVLFSLFIVELISLFLLSEGISKSISVLVYKLTHSEFLTINFLAILFLPGTIIHEVSHMLVAGILMVPVGDIELLPEKMDDGRIKMGSAEIGLTDPFRRALIGMAPLLVGASLIVSMLWLFNSFNNNYIHAAMLYMIFEIGNTMFSSKKDQEGLLSLLIGITVIGVLIFLGLILLKIQIPFDLLLQTVFTDKFTQFMQKANIYLLIPLGIDVGLYILFRLIHHRH